MMIVCREMLPCHRRTRVFPMELGMQPPNHGQRRRRAGTIEAGQKICGYTIFTRYGP